MECKFRYVTVHDLDLINEEHWWCPLLWYSMGAEINSSGLEMEWEVLQKRAHSVQWLNFTFMERNVFAWKKAHHPVWVSRENRKKFHIVPSRFNAPWEEARNQSDEGIGWNKCHLLKGLHAASSIFRGLRFLPMRWIRRSKEERLSYPHPVIPQGGATVLCVSQVAHLGRHCFLPPANYANEPWPQRNLKALT